MRYSKLYRHRCCGLAMRNFIGVTLVILVTMVGIRNQTYVQDGG
jgi:hypothetical protein